MICPECRAEYVGGVKICVDCGVPLVEHLPGEEPELTPLDDAVAPVDHEGDYEEVYAGLNRAEVALIKSLFDDAGFDYLCYNEQHPIPTEAMRILVRRDQVEEAFVVLRSLDEPET